MKKIIKLCVGWGFIIVGMVGLFLPFLQGILFLAIGAAILSSESPLVRKMIMMMRNRYPTFFNKMKEFKNKILHKLYFVLMGSGLYI